MGIKIKTPWHDSNGDLSFPYQMLGDLVFIWPTPPPEKLGKDDIIYLPECLKKKYHDGMGIILSIGPGYTDLKGKYHTTPKVLQPGIQVLFDISVPWGIDFMGLDGKKHYAVLCGVQDIFGIVN